MFLLPFVLKLLGGGIIQSMITARQNELASANATRKIVLEGEIAMLNAETERRKIAASLQQSDNQYLIMRLGKGLLMLAVGLYWSARIYAKLFGLDDFHVFIKGLDDQEYTISLIVINYWFASEFVKATLGR